MKVKVELFKVNKEDPGLDVKEFEGVTGIGATNTGFLKIETADEEYHYPLQMVYSYQKEKSRIQTAEIAK